MQVNFADSFYKSIRKIVKRQRWWYKTYDFFRYNLPNFIRNFWYFRKELWQFRSWDYSYNLMLFRRSLEKTANTIEVYGNEIDEPRLKKVAKMKRAIELLNNIRSSTYIEMAESELGEIKTYEWEFKEIEETDSNPLGEKNEALYELIDKETDSEKEHNSKVYSRAGEIEEQEWIELWQIIKGQDHKEYVEMYNKLTDEEKNQRDAWYDWYDGSGAKHWWD